jgi:hypothetical protein
MPITNFAARPFASVESAMTAAITAPTKPTPTTTTISRPSRLWLAASFFRRANSLLNWPALGSRNFSPVGLMEYCRLFIGNGSKYFAAGFFAFRITEAVAPVKRINRAGAHLNF